MLSYEYNKIVGGLMLRKIIGIILVIILLLLFACTITAQSNATNSINIIDQFEYKIGDCPTDENGIPINKVDNWHDYIGIDSLMTITDDNSIVWFRVKLPNINNTTSGIYFEHLYAMSLDIYVDNEIIFTHYRDWIYDKNTLLFPLQKEYSNKYLYIKAMNPYNKIGLDEKVLIASFKKLQNLFLSKDILNIYMGFTLAVIALIIFIYSFLLIYQNKIIGISLSFILLSIAYIVILSSTNFLMFFPKYEMILVTFYDLSLYIGLPLLTLFYKLVVKPKNLFIHKLWLVQGIYSICCIIFIIINILSNFQYNTYYSMLTLDIMGLLTILQLILLIISGINNTNKGNTNAKLFMLGFFAFTISLILEIGLYFIISNYGFYIWKYGLLLFCIALIIIFARQSTISHIQLREYSNEINRINKIAQTDFLTDLPNRMGISDQLSKALQEHRLVGQNLYLAICDLDDFKSLNDTYGHNFGDNVLVTVGQILKQTLGDNSIVGRWGGEEFLLLIKASDTNRAFQIVEQARLTINNYFFIYNNKQITLSATFGMCQYDDIAGLNTCLDYADKALYYGKENGKNVIIQYDKLILDHPELLEQYKRR